MNKFTSYLKLAIAVIVTVAGVVPTLGADDAYAEAVTAKVVTYNKSAPASVVDVFELEGTGKRFCGCNDVGSSVSFDIKSNVLDMSVSASISCSAEEIQSVKFTYKKAGDPEVAFNLRYDPEKFVWAGTATTRGHNAAVLVAIPVEQGSCPGGGDSPGGGTGGGTDGGPRDPGFPGSGPNLPTCDECIKECFPTVCPNSGSWDGDDCDKCKALQGTCSCPTSPGRPARPWCWGVGKEIVTCRGNNGSGGGNGGLPGGSSGLTLGPRGRDNQETRYCCDRVPGSSIRGNSGAQCDDLNGYNCQAEEDSGNDSGGTSGGPGGGAGGSGSGGGGGGSTGGGPWR